MSCSRRRRRASDRTRSAAARSTALRIQAPTAAMVCSAGIFLATVIMTSCTTSRQKASSRRLTARAMQTDWLDATHEPLAPLVQHWLRDKAAQAVQR